MSARKRRADVSRLTRTDGAVHGASSLASDALPNEVLAHVLGMLSCLDRTLRASSVCRRWRAVAMDPAAIGKPSCLDTANVARARLRAVRLGHAECVARLCQRGKPNDRQLYEVAIERDDVATLRALGVNEPVLDIHDMVAACARHASASCLAYAIERYTRAYVDVLWVPWNCDSADPCEHAVCLQLVHDSGQGVKDTAAVHAATFGHVECLRIALRVSHYNLDAVVVACGDDGDCLRVLYQHVSAEKWTCAAASSRGMLGRLRLMHSHGAPWDEATCAAAAKGGHLDCLRYAHENGCPWDSTTCRESASEGHLDCLRYAHENGCRWDDATCRGSARGGHLDCLRYAHENGCPWDKETCEGAASNTDTDCLSYAHESGCPWDEGTCEQAATHGRHDCLAYAHERGCPWSERALYGAINGDHVDCLRYMNNNGMGWDRQAYKQADRAGAWFCHRYMSSYFDTSSSSQESDVDARSDSSDDDHSGSQSMPRKRARVACDVLTMAPADE